MTLPVALTLGDPSGIGGEIALKAWTALRGRLAFFLIGDPDHMRRLGDAPRRAGAGRSTRPAQAAAATDGLPVLAAPAARAGRCPAAPTRRTPPPSSPSSPAASSWSAAAQALALCTNPINKKALIDGAGFAFPGHTEFLAHLSGAPLPVMMLAAPGAPGGAGHHPHPARRRARAR